MLNISHSKHFLQKNLKILFYKLKLKTKKITGIWEFEKFSGRTRIGVATLYLAATCVEYHLLGLWSSCGQTFCLRGQNPIITSNPTQSENIASDSANNFVQLVFSIKSFNIIKKMN